MSVTMRSCCRAQPRLLLLQRQRLRQHRRGAQDSRRLQTLRCRRRERRSRRQCSPILQLQLRRMSHMSAWLAMRTSPTWIEAVCVCINMVPLCAQAGVILYT
jgi:hypothetical protein